MNSGYIACKFFYLQHIYFYTGFLIFQMSDFARRWCMRKKSSFVVVVFFCFLFLAANSMCFDKLLFICTNCTIAIVQSRALAVKKPSMTTHNKHQNKQTQLEVTEEYRVPAATLMSRLKLMTERIHCKVQKNSLALETSQL